jgi:hypothetical protein
MEDNDGLTGDERIWLFQPIVLSEITVIIGVRHIVDLPESG